MRLLKFNEDNVKNVKSSLMKASAVGLSVLMFTSFFSAGCQANRNDDLEQVTEIVEEVTNPSTEYTQEVLDYLDINLVDVLKEATKLDTGETYTNLKLTKYNLQGLTVYETETGDFCVLSGDQRIPLILTEEGLVQMSSGVVRYDVEGFRTHMDFHVGYAKEEYSESMFNTEALDKENLEHAVLIANGVAFEDYVGTNRMVKDIEGKYYINLGRFSEYLGFEYADSETGDVVEESTLEDNKLLEAVSLSGFDGEVQYSFVKDTNKVVLLTRGIVEDFQEEIDRQNEINNWGDGKQEVVGEVFEEETEGSEETTEEATEETTEEITEEAVEEETEPTAEEIINEFVENNTVSKYLNVGEEASVYEDGILWIPVEYLQTAFGLNYTVEGKAITITDGHLLPKVVLLECVDSAGLEEVIAERKAEQERIEAERKRQEEEKRAQMEAQQRAEAERKAAEEAARRAAEEEAARQQSQGGHQVSDGPTPQDTSGGGGSGQPSSAFGGLGFGGLSGGSSDYNGSLDIR